MEISQIIIASLFFMIGGFVAYASFIKPMWEFNKVLMGIVTVVSFLMGIVALVYPILNVAVFMLVAIVFLAYLTVKQMKKAFATSKKRAKTMLGAIGLLFLTIVGVVGLLQILPQLFGKL